MNEFVSKTTQKPWGHYTVLYEDIHCKVKKIFVMAGHKLSLQSHQNRTEDWTIVSGDAVVRVGDRIFNPTTNLESPVRTFFIDKQTLHRIEAKTDLVFIEVQRGKSFAEDDIVRYEDDYGRVAAKE
jgi:mannose-6-phosphate isomerase-like protein (cupin superfamily)